jgi:3-hydroxybutyrate dehydrogenase
MRIDCRGKIGNPNMKLANKVALITGAAGGIGKAIATKFLAEGARVVIADLKGELAHATATQFGDNAVGIEMDVTDEASVNTGIAKSIDHFGGIDILVSNAGVQIVHKAEDFPFADWKKMMAIHLDGAFLTTKAVLPHMYKQGSGSIILMGSVHSKEASPLKSAYVTAKHGLLGLNKVLAKEGGKHGVRSNVICPGFVRTPLVEKQIPEQAARLGISEDDVVKKIMLGGTVDGEFTTLEDVAEVALLFAGFPTNALTGQSLVVSHGWFME